VKCNIASVRKAYKKAKVVTRLSWLHLVRDDRFRKIIYILRFFRYNFLRRIIHCCCKIKRNTLFEENFGAIEHIPWSP